jgi:hypothetical protein
MQERGRVIEDLGVQLPGFLDRFGRKFDLIEDGIAPGKGGIVPKVHFLSAHISQEQLSALSK